MITGPNYDSPGVAASYREHRTLVAETAQLWIDLVRGAAGGLHVTLAMDVGAGTGRFTRVLGDALQAPVIAVERSSGMIREREVTDPARARFVCAAAEALPFRTALADVVMVSMAYHQFGDRQAAVTEIRRVLRPGGRALVRTPVRETLGDLEWLGFFPEALAIDRERIPARDTIDATFRTAGFRTRSHAVVRQTIAAGREEYRERVRRRAFSTLRMIPDDVFARRLAEFDAYCRAVASGGPITEPIDFFVFDACR